METITEAQQKELNALEKKAHKWAEDMCNIPMPEAQAQEYHDTVNREIVAILGYMPEGFFYNTDPRGYALKIDNEKASVEGMHTDWGGFGILAPEA